MVRVLRSEYLLIMSMLHAARHDCAWGEPSKEIWETIDIAMTKLEASGGDYIAECKNDEHWARIRGLWDAKRKETAAHNRQQAGRLEALEKKGRTNPIEVVKVQVLPNGRMSRKNAAKYLGRAGKTLAMWALEGKGLRSLLVGGCRFYYKTDLDEFISSKAT